MSHSLSQMVRHLVRAIAWALIRALYRLRVRGLENLPERGPALLVANHVSFVDPFFIAACTQRLICFVMDRSFYEKPGLHRFFRFMETVPIDEGDSPRRLVASLREARRRLEEGRLVCVFAEGAITRLGHLLRFRRGFEHITRGLDAPIIPVHLDGVWGSLFSYERGRFLFKWPRGFRLPVQVSFGRPLPPRVTSFQVRQAVEELGAEAFAARDDFRRPLPALFLDQARRNWSRLALADGLGRKLTFGRALVGALLFRNLIVRRAPDEPMIGILLPPCVPAALANLAVSLAGRVAVNLNYTASAESLEHAIRECGLRTILTTQRLLEKCQIARRPEMILVEDLAKGISRGAKLRALLAARLLPLSVLRRCLLPRDLKLDSLATVIFSSGSTGLPKGVMLSHRNIVANLESIRQAIHVTPRDRILGVLPHFHAFGYTCTLWLPMALGFAGVYHTSPLDARQIGELCREHGVTILASTPTFTWSYVRQCEPRDFATVRLALVGAEKMKPELARAFREKFGFELFEGYGCTELAPVIAVGTDDYRAPDQTQVGNKAGSVGRALPGVAVRVVNPETGETLGPDQDGLLLVKGPNVMMGYLNEPEKTRQAFTSDGWYLTGDIARLDEDGFITLTDRLSRFSKIAGEMVPHVRVEDALQRAAGESEPKFVVTSLPDSQKGERLVVLYTGIAVGPEELVARLRESDLPNLWIPRKDSFFKVSCLPVLGSGKLDLRGAKEIAAEMARRQNQPVEPRA
jgi:acyl-[acyl-carrier-protein]-phospholipid O-acyltransferase/long-chain-fatty-acid--[acyl-carrier-protein] ligase